MSLGDFICLGVDAAVLSIVYILYRERRASLDNIRNAPVFEISDTLASKVAATSSDNCIPYAVVRGTVKAINQPIISHNAKKFTGVVLETLVREHKVRWNSFSRFWTEEQRNVTRSTNVVPFALVGPDNHSSVEVLNPLQAAYLPMVTIHDNFQPTKPGVWDTMSAFFLGEHSKGFRLTENMLTEGTAMTGVGALIVEGGRLRIEAPHHNLTYYLTTQTETSLIKSFESEIENFKVMCTILGAIGGTLLALILFKYYRRYRERADRIETQRRLRDVVTRRRVTPPGERNEEMTCQICLTNPREVLILDCGHVCCCADCGQVLDPALCPICRGPIVRLVPAYIS